ncbi:uncharacterized protein PV07_08799 [Cladophialophora immunda]|uniref:Uncharacterized protein n=1 Tax=Cladophialophora immunda TaxID=569365 RepID=A0A0D2C347_9EURO|nr:uncharacterized protein PV07_08799 [Cladophialophora immunda]KIW25633.1 hypothetical protein PV07_08799 [Cladophialophora immunda]
MVSRPRHPAAITATTIPPFLLDAISAPGPGVHRNICHFDLSNQYPGPGEQLRRLYGHPDNVEIYPSVVIEAAKGPKLPGSHEDEAVYAVIKNDFMTHPAVSMVFMLAPGILVVNEGTAMHAIINNHFIAHPD